jgi:transcriptional regulator with XRE-family HTH domain
VSLSNLKEAREKVGLNQRELAEKTHMAQSAISDLERGTRKVWPKAAERLSAALGIPASDLFPGDNQAV